MDIFNTIKNIFGSHQDKQNNDEQGERGNFGGQYNNFQPDDGSNFSMFADPFEMHRYFVQQMDELFKQFHVGSMADFNSLELPGEFPSFPNENERAIEPNSDLRSQFLKPGYERDQTEAGGDKMDKDVDGKFDIKDLDTVYREGSNNQISPRLSTPAVQFFGKSVQHRTVQNPDGSIEIHKTVRDSDGNEETTITRKMDDKEHTVTIKRSKDGKEERIENLVNMDQNDLDRLWKNNSLPESHSGDNQKGSWLKWFKL